MARQEDCWVHMTMSQPMIWQPVIIVERWTLRHWLIVGLSVAGVDLSITLLLVTMMLTVLAPEPVLSSSTMNHQSFVLATVLSVQRHSSQCAWMMTPNRRRSTYVVLLPVMYMNVNGLRFTCACRDTVVSLVFVFACDFATCVFVWDSLMFYM